MVTAPVKCALLNQLELSLLCFLAQLKGILTKQKYIAATVFVYDYIPIIYVHLLINLTSEEKLKAKQYLDA